MSKQFRDPRYGWLIGDWCIVIICGLVLVAAGLLGR